MTIVERIRAIKLDKAIRQKSLVIQSFKTSSKIQANKTSMTELMIEDDIKTIDDAINEAVLEIRANKEMSGKNK